MRTAPIDYSDGMRRIQPLSQVPGECHDSQCLSLVRLFGYMIREAPTSAARDTIFSEIVRCVDEDTADELAM